jgi:hypothetical protein
MSAPRGSRQREWPSRLGVFMLMIAGAALGLWVAVPVPQEQLTNGTWVDALILLLVHTLGGASLVGVPLLLWTARSRRWGAGRLLWFTQGTATWLLWPPIVYRRAVAGTPRDSMSEVCYVYGTPLMAVYVTLALLAGGYLSRTRRRRIWRSWQETLGLLLGLAWACTGLYVLWTLYRTDFFKK